MYTGENPIVVGLKHFYMWLEGTDLWVIANVIDDHEVQIKGGVETHTVIFLVVQGVVPIGAITYTREICPVCVCVCARMRVYVYVP